MPDDRDIDAMARQVAATGGVELTPEQQEAFEADAQRIMTSQPPDQG